MIGDRTEEAFLRYVRDWYETDHPFRLAIEALSGRLTPEEVRRYLPLLIPLARVKKGDP